MLTSNSTQRTLSIPSFYERQAAHSRKVVEGVQQGTINQNEFLDLCQDLNEVSVLGSPFGSGAPHNVEAEIALREKSLQQKIKTYQSEDLQPAILPSGLLNQALTAQAGQIFSGLKEATISTDEGLALMEQQQAVAEYGSRSRSPLRMVEMLLDTASSDIARARAEREQAAVIEAAAHIEWHISS